MAENQEPEAAAIAAAESIISEITHREVQVVPRYRRLIRALHSLGALQLLGRDWLMIGEEGFEFETITDLQADKLACLLEDLADGRVEPLPTAGPGQMALDFEPRFAPIVPPSLSQAFHPSAAR
jgi:hypothetical protein